MSKRTLVLIILTLIALIIFLIGIYLLFFRAPTIQQPTEPTFPIGTEPGSLDPLVTEPIEPVEPPEEPSGIRPVLTRLSLAPTAGSTLVDTISTTSSSTVVRYTDRATSHTYTVTADGEERTRITNTTIPKIQQAFWLTNSVLLRIGSISPLFFDALIGTIQQNNLSYSKIDQNITGIAVSPNKDRVALIVTNPNTNIDGSLVIANSSIANPVELLPLPLTEWTLDWPTTTLISLTTKPSSGVPGFLYLVNTTQGKMTKLLGDIAGLTTKVSPTGKTVLYTRITRESASDTPELFVYDDTLDRDSRTALPLDLQTFAEKCVWSNKDVTIAYCAVPSSIPRARYPNDWYIGNVFFTDSIYKINTKNGASVKLYDLPEQERMDVITPFLDKDENYLFFTNKQDYFLWSLRIADL